MGAWGVGSFENDGALDWLADLQTDGIAAVRSALSAVVDAEEQPDAPDCCNALAAAEVVAALAGNPCAELPEIAQEWCKGKGPPAADLRAQARAAVHAVLADSELQELFAESDSVEEWTAAVQDLRSRLA